MKAAPLAIVPNPAPWVNEKNNLTYDLEDSLLGKRFVAIQSQSCHPNIQNLQRGL
jgi:hypothetical protein